MREILAYIVGIIDGEGCIQIARDSAHVCYFGRIDVGMTDKIVIDFLQSIYPAHIYSSKLKSGKVIWRWRMTGWKIVRFLEDIYEFLRAKRNQADIIFDFYSKKGYICKKQGIPEKEVKRRTKLFEKLKKLHK